jgi:hypothetical protein
MVLAPGRNPAWVHLPVSSIVRLAANLDAEQVRNVEALADGMVDRSVLPVLGAGASCDCGVRLAREISRDLYSGLVDGHADKASVGADGIDTGDLGRTANAVAMLSGDPKIVLDAIGLDDDASWPVTSAVDDHFCAYRVLARLAREDFFREAVTFNYDCYFEAAMDAEGWRPGGISGTRWPQKRTVVTSAATHSNLDRPGSLALYKVHGCVAQYRIDQEVDDIVIRWTQLLDWREDRWARDLVLDRARRNVLLLIGFGAEDPVIHASLQRVMGEVPVSAACPRIRVIDPYPRKLALSLLIARGAHSASNVTMDGVRIRSDRVQGGLTAILLRLLDRWVWRTVAVRTGRAIPAMTPSSRVALTASVAPVAMRWTYALDPGLASLSEWTAEQQARFSSYIPLSAFPDCGIRVARTWDRLTRNLDVLDAPVDAIDSGFLVGQRGDRAYLPVGLSPDGLERANVGAVLGEFKLPHLCEPILVAEDRGRLFARVVGRERVKEL